MSTSITRVFFFVGAIVIITRAYLDEHRTKAGSWTMAQMSALGFTSLTPRKWRQSIIGTEISEETARKFEAGKFVFGRKTKRQIAKEEVSELRSKGLSVSEELQSKFSRKKSGKARNTKGLDRARRRAGKHLHDISYNSSEIAQAALAQARPRTETASSAHKDSFLRSYEWRRVRMVVLKKYGARCQCCGASPATGAVINVDHIKPRKLFPELALDVDNLQVLCDACNHGKGNWDMTDWRQSNSEFLQRSASVAE